MQRYRVFYELYHPERIAVEVEATSPEEAMDKVTADLTESGFDEGRDFSLVWPGAEIANSDNPTTCC